jgi:hypothetical protein
MDTLPQFGLIRHMKEQELVGTWRLLSQISQRADGTTYYPRGIGASGILMYDPYGNMSVQLMRVGYEVGQFEDFKTAMETYLAYFGTYRVDRKNHLVIHKVEGSSYPGYVGTDQVRRYAFNADRLTLTAEGKGGDGEAETRILMWQRVS